MVWMTNSFSELEFEERMMGREYIPRLTGLRTRTLRGTLTIEEENSRFPTQPFSRLPEIGNLSGNLVCGSQQEEEREGVVILEEEDADLESRSRIQDVPECVFQVVDPSGKRMIAGLRRIRAEKPRIFFYDEVIEGAQLHFA